MKRALIITVGTGTGGDIEATKSTAHAISISIRTANPEQVVFVVSDESLEKTIPEVNKELEDSVDCDFIHVKRIEDLNEVFGKVYAKIAELKSTGYDVVVDFTTGTKAMSAGAVLAAVSEATRVSYVTGRRIGGKVVRGGEQVLTYTPVMGIARMQQKLAGELFNLHQFAASQRILDSLHREIPDSQLATRLEELGRVVEGYYLWDMFRHEEAFERLRGSKRVPSHNKEFLGRLCSKEEKEPFFIADLINNAKRRCEEEKYDDALARLYRTIELIAQYRLKAAHGIITKDVELGELPEALREKYERLRDGDGKIRLGLFKAYELLSDLEDELGEKFVSNRRLHNLLKRRNDSILAHGLTSVDEDVVSQLRGFTLELAKQVVPKIEELMERARFPKFEQLA
jgi:hypothetical protein